MPTFFLDTPDILPLPSLQAYTTVSVLLLSCSVYYAFQVTSEPDWKLNATLSLGVTLESTDSGGGNGSLDLGEGLSAFVSQANETSLQLGLLLENPMIVRLIDVLYLMLHEPLCIWTLINMAYCCLILFGKFIQRLVFGDLRVSEQQHIKDRFWNFIFYKFIFIFGVMNVQFMDEVVLWCSWFSILGFLSLLAQLCKDRFEYLSFSPMTPKWTHFRLLLLLMGIFFSSLSLLVICILVGIHSGINTFAFMAAETALVMIKTSYVLTRYAIHLFDLNYEGVWENRASYSYYSELSFELSALAIDFCHHLHMLIWGNIILSMASLVILMQLRYLFYEIKRRVSKHQNYLQVIALMEANFPMATIEELDKNSDDCAICWDRMDQARKLPCGHLFHNSCLRSWLEQDTSCPTCRTSLKARRVTRNATNNANNNGETQSPNPHDNTAREHFFHFDGSRYASWLPSVSVEVRRPIRNASITRVVWGRRVIHEHNSDEQLSSLPPVSSTSVQTSAILDQPMSLPDLSSSINLSSLESMAEQVHEIFPHVPVSVIIQDLNVTQSIERTMDNILDSKLTHNLLHTMASTSKGSLETLASGTSRDPQTSSSVIHPQSSVESSSRPTIIG
jgi:autocrine motility factor receptor